MKGVGSIDKNVLTRECVFCLWPLLRVRPAWLQVHQGQVYSQPRIQTGPMAQVQTHVLGKVTDLGVQRIGLVLPFHQLGLLSMCNSFVCGHCDFFLSDLVMSGRWGLNFLSCWICLLKLPKNVRFQEATSMKRPQLRI